MSSGRGSSSGSEAGALLSLPRPLNGLIAAAAVLVGATVVASPVDWRSAALGALSALAASGAANALNDSLDAESDRVNRPERPVASGRVSRASAVVVALLLYVAAVALAGPLGRSALFLACAWVALTALYSLAFKGVPLLGNLVVAAVAASPLLMGGLSQNVVGSRLLVLFGLAALVHTARELVKAAEDVEGDEAAGTRTLAVVAGPRVAVAAARVLLVASMWAAIVPFAMRLMGWGYLALLVPIELSLAWLLVVSAPGAGDDGRALRRLSGGLKVVMVLGLAAFVAGTF